MNKVAMKHLAIFTIALSCIVLPCLALLITGIATPFISGFAVDNLERVYIGGTNEIFVFQDGNIVDTINPHTSRAYAFTINNDNNILLSTSTKIYIMDLDGNILSEDEDVAANIYNHIKYKSGKYTSSNGNVYEMKDYFGWTCITKNEVETVYRISFLSFIVKILIFGSVIAVIIFPIYITRRFVR